jgi:hypothetical protein
MVEWVEWGTEYYGSTGTCSKVFLFTDEHRS